MSDSNERRFDPVDVLSERFGDAIARAFPELDGPVNPLISASKQPKFGDFQSNVAMSLAKRVGMNPREVAQKLVAELDLGNLAEPADEGSIAGPGFINVKLRGQALAELLLEMDQQDLGISVPESPGTVVIDLCGVNLAKEMHVGHLRATVIGDALARVFERLGWRVIRQNHVGDWGLPIAMVTQSLAEQMEKGLVDHDKLTLAQLEMLYRSAQRACSADARGLEMVRKHDMGPKALAELEEQVCGAQEALERAKQTLVWLQGGDPETVKIWKRISQITMDECLRLCSRLHTRVTESDSAGESSYATDLGEVVDDLVKRQIAEESDGALVVRVDGAKEPCLVRKSDGGFLYATTDMAAIRRRVQEFGADRVIYAVDARQSLHFRLVFAAAHRAGYTTKPGTDEPAVLEHAAFGTILGEDNRPFKTRSGDNVKLNDLLDEAVARAELAVGEKNASLGETERQQIAEAVGITAIKYADLSNDRIRDYVFSFDQMLAFEGDTGPYLLYALVRTRSIMRKAKEEGIEFDPGAELLINEPAEKTLVLTILRYPTVVRGVAEALEPHRLCSYLYDLATAYSVFFDQCSVLRADSQEVRASRLRLCDLTSRVLADGFGVLGFPELDRM